MKNGFWSELVAHFFQGVTLRQLVHMIIIFILLVLVFPLKIKELIDSYNPEFLPEYSMYYILLFCLSFILSQLTGFIAVEIQSRLALWRVNGLTREEEQCLLSFIRTGHPMVLFRNHDPAVVSLVDKKILIHIPDPNGDLKEEAYVINPVCYPHIIRKFDSHDR